MATPGDQIYGPYRLLEPIGRGGMGVVYRARHLRLGNEAAVKLLPPDPTRREDALHRFEQEAVRAANLQHPHILPVWHFGEEHGVPYLVMPIVRGGSLADRLKQGSPPRWAALGYLEQMAAALDFAHAQQVIHRDVKPANMLFDEYGRLYLADFGLAKSLETTNFSLTGIISGTPAYMAPEQANSHSDKRTDLYALAVVAYELLTGRVPFASGPPLRILMQHARDPLPLQPLREAVPPLPPTVEGVLLRALAKDPDARYQSGQAFVEALRGALQGSPDMVAGQRPPAPPPPVWVAPTVPAIPTGSAAIPPTMPTQRPPAWRWPLVAGGAVLALLLLTVTGVLAATLISRSPSPTATPASRAAASTAPPAVTSTRPSAAPSLRTTPTPAPFGTVPTGWNLYRGSRLPFVMAYPPGWTVDESVPTEVVFASAQENTNFTITWAGPRTVTLGELRDARFNDITRACERATIIHTDDTQFSALLFFNVSADCEVTDSSGVKGHYEYLIGVALKNGEEWDYKIVCTLADFARLSATYFEPMLQTLNIYANP